MMLIVALTGGAGWLASLGLRNAGLTALSQRYALSVLAAYAVFLLLLRMWVWLHDKDAIDISDVSPGDGSSSHSCASGPQSSAYSNTDTHIADESLVDAAPDSMLPDGFPDIDDAGILILAIAVVAIVAVAAVWTVWIAPTLLAELVLDVTLASGLYRRLRRIEARHWLRTAIQKTYVPFAITLVFFIAIGAYLQHAAPEATSLGEALSIIAHR